MKRKFKFNLYIVVGDNIILERDLHKAGVVRDLSCILEYDGEEDDDSFSKSINIIINSLIFLVNEKIKERFNLEPLEIKIINTKIIQDLSIVDLFYNSKNPEVFDPEGKKDICLMPLITFYKVLMKILKDDANTLSMSELAKFLKANLPQLNLIH